MLLPHAKTGWAREDDLLRVQVADLFEIMRSQIFHLFGQSGPKQWKPAAPLLPSQDGEVRRLGSTQTVQTDVRILVATNKNLQAEIAAGRFREDLYYRLNVVGIHLPSLRERREDIPLLVDHFIRLHRSSINPAVQGITPEAQSKLVRYDWPGNVRELENTLKRALVLCRADTIAAEDVVHLGAEVAEPDTFVADGRGYGAALERFSRTYFIDALERHRGNVKKAAEEAGLSRKSVYEHLKRLDVDPAAFRRRA